MCRRALVLAVIAWTCVVAGRADGQGPRGVVDARVTLENEAVRVVLLTFPPGSASGRHTGLETEMGIVLEGELTLVTDGGREVLGPGTVHWLPALVPHDARNEGERPVKLWVVLFKRCD